MNAIARRWGLALCVSVLAHSASVIIINEKLFAADYVGVCPNGAPVKYEKYCSAVKLYRKTNQTGLVDSRISDSLSVSKRTQTRSIALVIAIGSYPHYDPITAATVDGKNWERFLTTKQAFDEVIVLQDEEATAEAIDYFLGDYLQKRPVDFKDKGRLLIVYSGHGRPDSGPEKAAFLLSAIDDVHGSANVYLMENFANAVESLAGSYFHVMTLINACYGGAFFGLGHLGGDPDMVSLPGAYAMTAGPNDIEVPSLDAQRGSLFFDLIIDGVDRGVADPGYWEFNSLVNEDGQTVKAHGLTRIGALNTYLTSAYAKINQMRKKRDPTFPTLVSPWFGPAEEKVAKGGFFFFSDAQIGTATDLVTAYGNNQPYNPRLPASIESFSVPSGPVSSLPGRPDIKVFKSPEVYPIHGYDLSSADAQIDWNAFSNTHPRFLYARAVGWTGPDRSFEERWAHAGTIGADRGAYVKFDFCTSVETQMAVIKRIVPNDTRSLPIAIELVSPDKEQDRQQQVAQLPCLQAAGVAEAKLKILRLADQLTEYYGKLPLMYGNRYNLSVLTDERFHKFMLWLGAYGANSKQLQGANPWTLWQYSGTLNVLGVGKNTTAEVFFGTEDQYTTFKSGQVNVALRAVAQ